MSVSDIQGCQYLTSRDVSISQMDTGHVWTLWITCKCTYTVHTCTCIIYHTMQELISSKQSLSRDRWLVWPHHDSFFHVHACIHVYTMYTCACTLCVMSAVFCIDSGEERRRTRRERKRRRKRKEKKARRKKTKEEASKSSDSKKRGKKRKKQVERYRMSECTCTHVHGRSCTAVHSTLAINVDTRKKVDMENKHEHIHVYTHKMP